MSGIACLLHQLREKLFIQRHTVGLTGPYDLVLHARVDLKSEGKKRKLNILLGNECGFSLKKGTISLGGNSVANQQLCKSFMSEIGHSSVF